MTRIARIELYHVRIPLPDTFWPAWIPGYPMTQNRFTLIKLFTDDGVEGISAGPAMVDERSGLGNLLGPYLLGEDPTDIDVIQQRLREVGYLGWRNYWIEPACWDIKGKLAGEPVCRLLGGAPRFVKLYASTGEVKEPRERIDEVEARYDEGFRSVKLRVHDFDEAVDIEQVRRVCEAVGDKMEVGVDANQGWRVTIVGDAPLWDLARAKRFADACADFGVGWLEEPLPMDAWDDQVALREHSKVPITGGELHTGGYRELKAMMERGCYDVYQPDAVFTGGIAQTFAVAQACREHGVLYTPHTWTNGIGFAINLQLVAAAGFADQKALEYPVAPPGWTVEGRDGLLQTPFHHDHGTIEVPRDPGLGIALDERAMKRYAKRFFVMDRKRLTFFALKDRGLKVARQIDAAKKAKAKAQGRA
jgi:D-galactarolactone cycloisomerase